MRRLVQYITSLSVCQDLFQKFFIFFSALSRFFRDLLRPSFRSARLLYHFLPLLSIPFLTFLSLLYTLPCVSFAPLTIPFDKRLSLFPRRTTGNARRVRFAQIVNRVLSRSPIKNAGREDRSDTDSMCEIRLAPGQGVAIATSFYLGEYPPLQPPNPLNPSQSRYTSFGARG